MTYTEWHEQYGKRWAENYHSQDQKVITRRYWGSDNLYKIQNALCSDGVKRVATVTGEPDTYFSAPARVQVKGKTVTGSLSRNYDGVWIFSHNLYGKNANILPKMPLQDN